MAIGLSCPSLSAPSFGIRAMIGFSPSGHFCAFSMRFSSSANPCRCALDNDLSSAGLQPSTPLALPSTN
eukprot:904313-Heterocapsa_arctica.AAC.1